MAIRQVTQLNQGKRTAGVDGKASLNHRERFQLAEGLAANVFDWQHQGLREIPIPKKDGTTRMLKVPTIRDRAWQCLVKYAMEPAHEATFHKNSYGFRPGRGCWDAQSQIFLMLSKNSLKKNILELDIEKCFDRIDHSYLLKKTICPQSIKTGLLRCLSAGTKPGFVQGTPQGGVISPLLANVALNGIEDCGKIRRVGGKVARFCVRYADDMVFILPDSIDPKAVLAEVTEALIPMGLNVKQSKTHIVHSTTGFDFLGWNFRVKPRGKTVITPAKANYRAFYKKVKAIILHSNLPVSVQASALAQTIRGWWNYHRYCKMTGSAFSLWGLNNAYFYWLTKKTKLTVDERIEATKKAFNNCGYRQNGHVKVKGDRTPFDGDFIYWSKRNSKFYDGFREAVLKKQGHLCAKCGLSFVGNERLELHHKDGNHQNWRRLTSLCCTSLAMTTRTLETQSQYCRPL